MQVGECGIARLGRQNRKFPPILIMNEAKNFSACKRSDFVHQEFRDFVKITVNRVNDCDSSRVIL